MAGDSYRPVEPWARKSLPFSKTALRRAFKMQAAVLDKLRLPDPVALDFVGAQGSNLESGFLGLYTFDAASEIQLVGEADTGVQD